MTSAPPPGEQTSNGDIRKPRRTELWLLAIGGLILLVLLGYLLNQQRTSSRTPDIDDVERTKRESAPVPGTEARPSDATRRNDAGTAKPKTATPMRVVYMVTHKHRLRDCHGKLTFTRNGLRFDSDEPEDSFNVGRDDVTLEGDVLRIRDKSWRFEFTDGVRVERLFSDWKAGTLPAVPAP